MYQVYPIHSVSMTGINVQCRLFLQLPSDIICMVIDYLSVQDTISIVEAMENRSVKPSLSKLVEINVHWFARSIYSEHKKQSLIHLFHLPDAIKTSGECIGRELLRHWRFSNAQIVKAIEEGIIRDCSLGLVSMLCQEADITKLVASKLLMSVFSSGSVAAAQLLLEYGADIDSVGWRALELCSLRGHSGLCRLLLDEVKSQDFQYLDFALQIAARKGHLEIVAMLIDVGADPRSSNDAPIRFAAPNGHAATCELLLKAGANANAEDNYALRWSSFYGHGSVVEVLLRNDSHDAASLRCAMKWSARRGHEQVLEMLRKAALSIEE